MEFRADPHGTARSSVRVSVYLFPPKTRRRKMLLRPTSGRIRSPNRDLERHETPAPEHLRPVHHTAHVTRPNRAFQAPIPHPPTPRHPIHPTRPNRSPHPPNRTPKSTRPRRLPNRPHPPPIPHRTEPQDLHAHHKRSTCQQASIFSAQDFLHAGVCYRATAKTFSPDPAPSSCARAHYAIAC